MKQQEIICYGFYFLQRFGIKYILVFAGSFYPHHDKHLVGTAELVADLIMQLYVPGAAAAAGRQIWSNRQLPALPAQKTAMMMARIR